MAETVDLCAAFELGEVSVRSALVSPREQGAVHRRQTWTDELRVWALTFSPMNDAMVTRLKTIWLNSFFGALWVLWTPPGESEATFRIVGTGLEITQVSANAYEASIELAEVR